MSEPQEVCIWCERTSQEIPLMKFEYAGKSLWICPIDLPILIHKPAQLANKIPGAENFNVKKP